MSVPCSGCDDVTSNEIKVGQKYYSQRMDIWFNIILELPNTELPFVGIDDDLRRVVNFNRNGKDKWMECGGHWYSLDLTTEKSAKIGLCESRVY